MSELNPNLGREGYGGDYQKHLLEQYKLYIDSLEKTSDRRGAVNSFFLTLHSAVLTVAGILYSVSMENNITFTHRGVILLPLFILLLLCAAWALQLRYYRNLNENKFKVVDLMERELPAAMYVELEWRRFQKQSNYIKLHWLELVLPGAFALVYLIGAILFML